MIQMKSLLKKQCFARRWTLRKVSVTGTIEIVSTPGGETKVDCCSTNLPANLHAQDIIRTCIWIKIPQGDTNESHGLEAFLCIMTGIRERLDIP
jgi:hypothetical protein